MLTNGCPPLSLIAVNRYFSANLDVSIVGPPHADNMGDLPRSSCKVITFKHYDYYDNYNIVDGNDNDDDDDDDDDNEGSLACMPNTEPATGGASGLESPVACISSLAC